MLRDGALTPFPTPYKQNSTLRETLRNKRNFNIKHLKFSTSLSDRDEEIEINLPAAFCYPVLMNSLSFPLLPRASFPVPCAMCGYQGSSGQLPNARIVPRQTQQRALRFVFPLALKVPSSAYHLVLRQNRNRRDVHFMAQLRVSYLAKQVRTWLSSIFFFLQ